MENYLNMVLVVDDHVLLQEGHDQHNSDVQAYSEML